MPFTAGHTPSAESVAAGVRSLRDAGAEIVVVSAHWGNEASYYQNANQEEVGRAAIDAGASIVFGHGPHRLEPFEKYNNGIIFYSLGNFVFGRQHQPADMDSVIARRPLPATRTERSISRRSTFCRAASAARQTKTTTARRSLSPAPRNTTAPCPRWTAHGRARTT